MKLKLMATLILLSCVVESLQLNFLEEYSENEFNTLVEKLKPVFVFHSEEKYFPLSIEQLNIDWSKADMSNSSSRVSYEAKPNKLNKTAPIYVSVLQNTTDNTLRITYAMLYSFNDCGPYFKGHLETNFGFSMDPEFSICPMGKHYGDIERITLYLKKTKEKYEISNFEYAGHGDTLNLLPNQIEYIDGHPVIYVARGSHASYPKQDKYVLEEVWNHSASTFSIYGRVEESTIGNSLIWSNPTVRILKLNGEKANNISKEEEYLSFIYKGRLGDPITNEPFDYFENEISTYINSLEKISPDASKKVLKAIEYIHKEVTKNAIFALARTTRGWW